MKKIKLLGLIIGIALIYLIFKTSNNNNFTNIENSERIDFTKENIEEVINNGGSVLEYNNYIYYILASNTENGGFTNKLCRKNKQTNEEEVLYDGERYKIENRLIIFNNNIFFSMVGQTYYINLENTNYISKYNSGILYTIGNEKLIYADGNNIFKGTYYKNTLAINSVSKIATMDPNFMFEDEKNLYFYSNNEDNSKSVVSVNKEHQNIKVLDRIYFNKNANIIDIKQSNNYIYIILNDKKYIIRKIAKDGNKIDSQIISSKPTELIYTQNDNLYYKLNNESLLYEYNAKENKIVEIKEGLNKSEIYNLRLSGKNVSIFKGEVELAVIARDIDESINNVLIEEIKNDIYIRFEIGKGISKDIMFWKIGKDGTNLERINL